MRCLGILSSARSAGSYNRLYCYSPENYPLRKMLFRIGLERMILKTAVGPCKKVQDFDPEPLDTGVEHSQKVKATPASRGSGSKDCALLPASTAVFRLRERIPQTTSLMRVNPPK